VVRIVPGGGLLGDTHTKSEGLSLPSARRKPGRVKKKKTGAVRRTSVSPQRGSPAHCADSQRRIAPDVADEFVRDE